MEMGGVFRPAFCHDYGRNGAIPQNVVGGGIEFTLQHGQQSHKLEEGTLKSTKAL